MKQFFWIVVSLVVFITAGCTSGSARNDRPSQPASLSENESTLTPKNKDPLLRLNKGVYTFNTTIDNAFLKPAAKGYDAITPGLIGRGISNFFQNLSEPRVMLNSALQGKLDRGMTSFARFFINSTVGIGGLIDWAGLSGAPYHDEDFGQTLAVWGWKKDTYVMLPVLGPSNVRDSMGTVVDFFTYPLLYYKNANTRNSLYVVRVVNSRANALIATDIIDEAAGDKDYEFVREAYKQRRKSQVSDGAAAPLEGLEFIEEN